MAQLLMGKGSTYFGTLRRPIFIALAMIAKIIRKMEKRAPKRALSFIQTACLGR